MIKGAKAVTAMSPAGAIVTVCGAALQIGRKVQGSGHFTVHELEKGDAIVAIIPLDWHIQLELNQ